VLAKLKKTHVARKRLVDMPDNTKLQWFTGGGSPIGTKGRKEKREEELRRWYQGKRRNCVALSQGMNCSISG